MPKFIKRKTEIVEFGDGDQEVVKKNWTKAEIKELWLASDERIITVSESHANETLRLQSNYQEIFDDDLLEKEEAEGREYAAGVFSGTGAPRRRARGSAEAVQSDDDDGPADVDSAVRSGVTSGRKTGPSSRGGNARGRSKNR